MSVSLMCCDMQETTSFHPVALFYFIILLLFYMLTAIDHEVLSYVRKIFLSLFSEQQTVQQSS